MYFEDFFAQKNKKKTNINGENSCFSYDNETSSLVSDAASLVMKKENDSVDKDDNTNEEAAAAAVGLSINSRFNYGSEPLFVYAQIYDLIMMKRLNKSTKQGENMDIISSSPSLQEKEGRGPTRQIEEDLGFTGKESDTAELKKKGLCLVPLSMVVNFFA
ncbi:hypothetical protein GH714_008211 [Hevea brasiliensis]|uniref:Uncharacterized protein n=1 Tax=Hevea brasiliensis TaxID=3981 RepID=A0A6A6KAB5_HEVBR|nr:hypothetical protein GH714_008211 [Hevea brasiliensis]